MCLTWSATKTGFGLVRRMESCWEMLSSAVAALKSTSSRAKWSGHVEDAIHHCTVLLHRAQPRSSGWGWCCLQVTACPRVGGTNMHGSYLSCALTSTAFPFVNHLLHVLSKRDFFYSSSDPSHNREFMELAWPRGELLHHHIDPLIESHSQMRKMKQETTGAALSLWGAGLVPQEGKTRVCLQHSEALGASKPLAEVSWDTDGRCTSDGWLYLTCHICVCKNPLMQLLQKKIKIVLNQALHGWFLVTKIGGDNQSGMWQYLKCEIYLHLVVKKNNHGSIPSFSPRKKAGVMKADFARPSKTPVSLLRHSGFGGTHFLSFP